MTKHFYVLYNVKGSNFLLKTKKGECKAWGPDIASARQFPTYQAATCMANQMMLVSYVGKGGGDHAVLKYTRRGQVFSTSSGLLSLNREDVERAFFTGKYKTVPEKLPKKFSNRFFDVTTRKWEKTFYVIMDPQDETFIQQPYLDKFAWIKDVMKAERLDTFEEAERLIGRAPIFSFYSGLVIMAYRTVGRKRVTPVHTYGGAQTVATVKAYLRNLGQMQRNEFWLWLDTNPKALDELIECVGERTPERIEGP